MLRGSAWLHVLSLVCFVFQLAVAAAHFHNETSGGVVPALTLASFGGAGASLDEPQQAPPDHGGGRDHCLICWSAAVGASALLTSPGDATPPANYATVDQAAQNAALEHDHRTAAFDARGPPKRRVS